MIKSYKPLEIPVVFFCSQGQKTRQSWLGKGMAIIWTDTCDNLHKLKAAKNRPATTANILIAYFIATATKNLTIPAS